MLGDRSKDISTNPTRKMGEREMSIFNDPNFDEMFHNAIYNSREDVVDAVDNDDWLYDDDDYQPTHYEECQDLYGGDDWDHGQYDEY
jgi:hypothetical protein